MSDWQTNLKLTLSSSGQEIVIPYEASRGTRQSITQIDGGADFRRTVNGDLVVVANPNFRRYAVEISGNDSASPALGGVWIGDQVTVECITPISQRMIGGTAALGRDPVPGSVECYNAAGDLVSHLRSVRSVTAAGAVFVRYRPILDCFVTSAPNWDGAELSLDVSWSLQLEEV